MCLCRWLHSPKAIPEMDIIQSWWQNWCVRDWPTIPAMASWIQFIGNASQRHWPLSHGKSAISIHLPSQPNTSPKITICNGSGHGHGDAGSSCYCMFLYSVVSRSSGARFVRFLLLFFDKFRHTFPINHFEATNIYSQRARQVWFNIGPLMMVLCADRAQSKELDYSHGLGTPERRERESAERAVYSCALRGEKCEKREWKRVRQIEREK